MSHSAPILQIQDLSISFETEYGRVQAVTDLNLHVSKGETLAIVGESGCGKSITSLAILNLLPENGYIDRGSILFQEENLLQYSNEQLRKIRGNEIAMIFQEPMTALNPVFTIGFQIKEVFEIHQKLNSQQAKQAALEMLALVKIPDPKKCFDEYPYQLSGGMRQRALIAMALACKPKLLLADEPTTALDVTIQAQILKLMDDLKRQFEMSMIFITHDLGVVAEIADKVMVMYAGEVYEYCDVFQLFKNPKHPYTQGLLQSMPSLTRSKEHRLHTIPGQVPDLHSRGQACHFAERCPHTLDSCRSTKPAMTQNEHKVACFYANKE